MHTDSSDMFLFSFVLKSVGGRAFPLGAEVNGLYIKVAFINIIYVTWNNYWLKSEEKDCGACLFFLI